MLEAKKTLKLISILLGFVSIADVVLLGIYVASSCLRLAFLNRFLTQAIAVVVMTIVSTALILFGCFSIYRDRFVLAGMCDLVAGAMAIGIYLYYTLDFPILEQFGLLGYSLLLPAPINALIAIVIYRME